MRKFIAFGPALVVLLAALVTLIAAPAAVRNMSYAATDSQIQLAQQSLEQDSILKQIDRAVRNIADLVEPSVVHIRVQTAQNTPRRFGGRGGSQGSGWVFDDDGHIITNNHVVKDGVKIFVQFQDGRAVEAEVVGRDPRTDVAVLRVATREGLFPIRRATGTKLHQGERVYAFGSPFGFKFSMSEGIVSGLGRDPEAIIGANEGYTNFIQTDAAVNPGNSGGPLVNIEGKLVGMNVAIATAPGVTAGEGQSAGISFAIPLDTIESVAKQIISGGVVSRGFLGINHLPDDDDNTQALNRMGFRGRGVVVTQLAEDGPAGKAGIQVNDIIVALNNQPVTGVPVLRSAISNNQPGDKVKVELVRNGTPMTVEVTLGALPPARVDLTDAAAAIRRFGINDLVELNGEVLVDSVVTPSLAAQSGLRPQQSITAVEGQAVSSLRELFFALVERGLHQGRPVKITVKQGDQFREITIRP